jgi:4-hydroxybenzoate polyprenyltransferase
MCLYCITGVVFGLFSVDHTLQAFISAQGHQLLIILLSVGLWYMNGTALNDYADYEIDLINLKGDKHRPLVMGMITKKQLLKIAIFCAAIALVAVISIGNTKLVVLFGVLFMLNWAYSFAPFQISRRGGFAPLLLPLGYTTLTVLSGVLLTTSQLQTKHYVLVLAFYIHFLSRILLKDYRDVIGDKKAGKMTLLLKKGNLYIVKLAIASFIASCGLFLYLMPSHNRLLVPFYAFIATYAVWGLVQLSQTELWHEQKIYIPIFGRMCTAFITLFIFNLVSNMYHLSQLRVGIFACLLTLLFVISVLDIFRYHSASK